MLQRQDSLLSMSHRQTPPPPTGNHHAKPAGCMSAIFKLFSKYRGSKKRLTFRKKNKCGISTPTKTKFLLEPKDSPTQSKEDSDNSSKDDENSGTKRLRRDITPRSPTLRPEIRLPNDAGLSGNTKAPPSLVARLMGMEKQEEPPQHPRKRPLPVLIGESKPEEVEEEEEEEKRKRLLQALKKCNEDLESLKKIIMAVQSADKRRRLGSDQPSETCNPRPVSGVLSPPSRYSYSNGNMPEQRKQIVGKKPGEEDSARICMFKRVQAEPFKMRRNVTTPKFWNSRAMIQSVDEVCDDIVWGEERELRNVGLALDNYISRDLIEEVVYELGFRRSQRLPFHACRRRISF